MCDRSQLVTEARNGANVRVDGRIGLDKEPEGAPEYPDGVKSPVKHVCGPRRPRASDDDYPAVVATLDEKTRVVECANGIQWIVQRRRGRLWGNIYFCRTRAGLLLYAHPVTPELLALPDYFPV